MLPKEELHGTNKGDAPFISWSIDAMGKFPRNEDRNYYFFVAMDLLSKWVETHTMPLLYCYRAANFLYDYGVAHWGKLCYIQIDNSAKFSGSFMQLCKRLGILHYHITISNSKADG